MNQEFEKLVQDYGRELRTKSYNELLDSSELPAQLVDIDGRKGTIALIVESESGETLRIVVQGFLDGKWWARLKEVQLDGFRIDRDGVISALADEEFYGFD